MSKIAKVLSVMAAVIVSGFARAADHSMESRGVEQIEGAIICPPLNYLNYAKQEKMGRRLDAAALEKIKLDAIALFYSVNNGTDSYCVDPATYNRNVLDLQRMRQVQPMAFENLQFVYDIDSYNRRLIIELTPDAGIALRTEIENSNYKIPTEQITGTDIPKPSYTLDGSIKLDSLDPQLRADLVRFGFDLSKVKINARQDPRVIDSIEVMTAGEDQINTFKAASYLRSQKYPSVSIAEGSRISKIFAGGFPIYSTCAGCGPDAVFRVITPTGIRRYVIQNNGVHYFEVTDTNAIQIHTPNLSTLTDLKQWYPEVQAIKIARQRNE